LFVSGSAPLAAELFEAFTERTGHIILERYGMTETNILTSNPYAATRRGGTVGFAMPGTQLRIVDAAGECVATGEIGAIQVKGDNVFPGYWRQPEKTRDEFATDGFFKTGDMGYIDADGYVTIVGRSKDLIITGGLNVYPKEIEECLNKTPGILESAVIGVPHPDFGEAVTAVVVSDPSRDERSIIAALKNELANYKVPKRVHFVRELPRNALGKVQKNLLRQRFAEQLHA
jgi:malonyl-CoA/methylmalonyl-CoA synthetase